MPDQNATNPPCLTPNAGKKRKLEPNELDKTQISPSHVSSPAEILNGLDDYDDAFFEDSDDFEFEEDEESEERDDEKQEQSKDAKAKEPVSIFSDDFDISKIASALDDYEESEDEFLSEEPAISVEKANGSDEDFPMSTVELDFGSETNQNNSKKDNAVSRKELATKLYFNQIHTLCVLCSSLYMCAAANDPCVQGLVLSLGSTDSIDRAIKSNRSGSPETKKRPQNQTWLSTLESLLGSLGIKGFRTVTGTQDPKESYTEQLIDRINNGIVFEPWERSVMVVALLRGCGYLSRLCTNIYPTYPENPESSEGTCAEYWCEVYSPIDEDWIVINPNSLGIETASRFACKSRFSKHQSSKPTSNADMIYAVGFDNRCHSADITRRYCPAFNTVTLKARKRAVGKGIVPFAQDWWDLSLQMWKNPKPSAIDKREQERFEAMGVIEKLPTTITGFMGHPLYVLERHIGKTQALYPKEPVIGYVRGEPVYLRSCVQKLYSASKWLRLGRCIKPGEKPTKMLLKSSSRKRGVDERNSGSNTDIEGETKGSLLFGEWQTAVYVPPAVDNGCVPKDSYGRLDVFQPSMVPAGGAHVKVQGAIKLCKRYGIDCAEAVVGFDFRKNRVIPVVQGVIVAKESEQLLLDACRELSDLERERLAKDKYVRALALWRNFIRGLQIGMEVDQIFKKHRGTDKLPTKSSEKEPVVSNIDDDDDDDEKESKSNKSDDEVFDTGGGFILD
ncbi:hypothetical protein H4219_001702 [Mycoemilia scoparia]|uniref:Uncharacterized protein n=1 Tax=Mycoemilia scoparia TaxID=417184 RepID=A0A9W8A2Z7_9FUNG|nr:hypothetical protein H4219_001702 [Mycoemilia scoparia]